MSKQQPKSKVKLGSMDTSTKEVSLNTPKRASNFCHDIYIRHVLNRKLRIKGTEN